MRESISSGHFSVDQQSADALDYLKHHAPEAYADVLQTMPEAATLRWGEHSSWFDTDAMGVDEEWGSWLADAIEATGIVWWEDGEPWIGDQEDDET